MCKYEVTQIRVKTDLKSQLWFKHSDAMSEPGEGGINEGQQWDEGNEVSGYVTHEGDGRWGAGRGGLYDIVLCTE